MEKTCVENEDLCAYRVLTSGEKQADGCTESDQEKQSVSVEIEINGNFDPP